MLRIWLAGPLRLELDGAELSPPSSRRARLLLAMLAVERWPQSRETLAARLWPDVLDESARVSLRTALVRLRAALGPNAGRFLDATRETIALAGPDRVWTDVGEIERRLEAGEVEAALELYGEELLVGLEDEWVYERRDVLAQRLADAAGLRAAALEAAGDLEAALALTRRRADLDPLAEAAHRDLIRRFAAVGDPAAALATYQKLAKRLREQLYTVPSAATRELAETIRSRAAEPARKGAAGQRPASGQVALVAPPATRYAQSGDVSIAYQVVGDGAVDLVYIPGGISHVDLQWTNRAWAEFLGRLASFARLITFDWRGTGLSDPVAEAPTLDQHMADVHAVMAAAGSERAAVLGFSAGGLLAAQCAANDPELTEALILWDAFATVTLNGDDEPDREVWPRLRRLHLDAIEHWGEGRFLHVVAPSVADNADIRRAYGQFERAALSPATARALFEAVEGSDIRSALPQIQIPTLVIDHPDAPLYAQRGRYLAERIPGARLVELEGHDHLPLVGPQVIGVADVVEDFLLRRGGRLEAGVASVSG
jgi:DNA-binding SARP family transcriptional activator/pimeloyl-ACP methyl ester carboxylesterase